MNYSSYYVKEAQIGFICVTCFFFPFVVQLDLVKMISVSNVALVLLAEWLVITLMLHY